MTLAVGSFLPQRSLDRAVADVARECEDLGFGSVAVIDHLHPLGGPPGAPLLDAFSTVAAVAAVTSRVRIVTAVVRAGLRPRAMTVHLARTAAALAGERLVLGLGSGDAASAVEDALLGIPARSMADRRAELRETVAAVRAALPATPVWIGGRGAATRALAGELADGWNAWAATPDEVRAEAPAVAAAAVAVGRAIPPTTWAGQVLLDETAAGAASRLTRWATATERDRATVIAGGPDEVAAGLRALADVGVTECLVAFVAGDAGEQRRRFARHVVPLL